MKNTKTGWTLLGKSSQVMAHDLDRLRKKGFKIYIDADTKCVYYRKTGAIKPVRIHDYAKQDYLKKKQTFLKRFKALIVFELILLGLTANVIYMLNVPEIQAMSLPEEQFTAEVNLTPVRFTDEEWADIHAKQAKAKKENWSVEDHIKAVFGDDSAWAIRCFKSESGLRPNAINDKNRNKTIDVGVAQINTPTHCRKLGESNWNRCIESLQDIETNLKVAKSIYDRQGSKPWYGANCN